MTKVWAGPTTGWAYLGLGARLLHSRVRGLGLESALPHPGRSDGAAPCGTRRFALRSSWKGVDVDFRQRNPVHQRPFYRHLGTGRHRSSPHCLQPSRRQRTHRTLSPLAEEEEVWLNEYQSLDQARDSIARWMHQYNHQRPHQSLKNRTPAETRRAFTQPQPLTYIEALCV